MSEHTHRLSEFAVPLSFAGGSLLYVWPFFLGSEGGSGGSIALSTVLAPLFFVLLWRFFSKAKVRRYTTVALALLGSAGTLVSLAQLGVVGAELVGFASAALILFWYVFFARLPLKKAAMSFALMQIFAPVLVWGAQLLPAQYYPGLALCVPVLSGVLLLLAHREADALGFAVEGEALFAGVAGEEGAARLTASPNIGRDLRWKFLLLAFVFAFAYGLGRMYNVPTANRLAFGLSGVLLLVMLVIFLRKHSIYTIFNVSLPIAVLGLVLLTAGLSFYSGFGATLLFNTGYALATGVFMLLVANKTYRFGVPGLWAAGVLRTALALGVFAGNLVSTAVFDAAAADTYRQLLYGLALFILVIAVILWLQDSRGQVEESSFAPEAGEVSVSGEAALPGEVAVAQAGATAAPSPAEEAPATLDAYKTAIIERCDSLVSEYKMSKREAEIFQYLALGWSVPRIAEELVIAESTARTHAKHIYVKLGIHSRDELKMLLGLDGIPA